MTKEKQEYFFKHYPKMFVKTDFPMKSAIYFGLECGDGWFTLLDDLCYNIQYDIDHNWTYEVPKYIVKLQRLSNRRKWVRKIMGKHIEKIRNYLIDTNKIKRIYPQQVVVTQIKEKFGTLRFYYVGGNERIAGYISFAESLTSYICEACGTTMNVGSTNGWIRVICKECAEETNVIQHWFPNPNCIYPKTLS